jgi:sodium/proline symporter
MTASQLFTTTFVFYLVVVVMVALLAWRVTLNLSDFVLGGRRLNGPVAALSAGASDMSAWLLLALPGAAFTFGLNQIWLPIGLCLGAYLNWLIVARPLRVYTERANDALTVPAFLDARLSDAGHRIRMVSALATLVFFAVYTASGLVGGALLMERSFDLDYTTGLLVGTAIIVAYTCVGGFLAVSWTDFFQGNFMFICLMAVPIMVIGHEGGVSNALAHIQAIRPEALEPFKGLSILGALNLLAWGLGYFGQPHILVRFMAVRSDKDIPIARRVSMAWMISSLLGAVLTGFLGIAYFNGVISNAESVFISFAHEIFSPGVSGLIMAAILSSIMCAIDSQMLASTSAITEDIYHPFIRPNASQIELVWVGRLALIVIALVAVSLALRSGKGVLDLVSFAWSGLGSTFAVPVLLALFYRRFTANGALLAMILGGVTSVIWSLWIVHFIPVYEIVPGIAMSLIGGMIGSKIGLQPSSDQLFLFDSVHQQLES